LGSPGFGGMLGEFAQPWVWGEMGVIAGEGQWVGGLGGFGRGGSGGLLKTC